MLGFRSVFVGDRRMWIVFRYWNYKEKGMCVDVPRRFDSSVSRTFVRTVASSMGKSYSVRLFETICVGTVARRGRVLRFRLVPHTRCQITISNAAFFRVYAFV